MHISQEYIWPIQVSPPHDYYPRNTCCTYFFGFLVPPDPPTETYDEMFFGFLLNTRSVDFQFVPVGKTCIVVTKVYYYREMRKKSFHLSYTIIMMMNVYI